MSIRTRDVLAAQARQRGLSISALLTELASAAERQAIFRSERDATRADVASRGVGKEDRDWEDTVSDGLA